MVHGLSLIRNILRLSHQLPQATVLKENSHLKYLLACSNKTPCIRMCVPLHGTTTLYEP
jgi:hypothetical protein